jgi:hypothetical protein
MDWEGRRWNRTEAGVFTEVPDDGPESKLAGKISKWAREHGYPILNFRQSKKAAGFIPPGWPDVTCVLPGRVVFIELKSASGRLRREQHVLAIQFSHLGNAIHCVKSFRRFLEIVNEIKEKGGTR